MSCSSQLPVLYKSDPHAVSGLGQAIDKKQPTRKERAESGAWSTYTSRDPPGSLHSEEGTVCDNHSPKFPRVPQVWCQLPQCHRDTQSRGIPLNLARKPQLAQTACCQGPHNGRSWPSKPTSCRSDTSLDFHPGLTAHTSTHLHPGQARPWALWTQSCARFSPSLEVSPVCRRPENSGC